jgi:hypothetical protein
MNYKLVPALALPKKLKTEIEQLDWTKLSMAYRADRLVFLKEFFRSKKYKSWKSIRGFQKYYGFFLQNIGTIEYYHLPEDLLSSVQSHYSNLFKSITENPVIRLQIIHSGSMIPLHIDLTRSTSLIIPVLHRTQAKTNFYSLNTMPNNRGMIEPTDCKLLRSIIIDQVPALLDVDEIHAVTYDKNTLTPDHPRVSVNLKWPETKFNVVANALKGKNHGL